MGGWNSMNGLWKVSLVDMCLLTILNIWSLRPLYTRIRSTILFSDCSVEREGGREGGREEKDEKEWGEGVREGNEWS